MKRNGYVCETVKFSYQDRKTKKIHHVEFEHNFEIFDSEIRNKGLLYASEYVKNLDSHTRYTMIQNRPKTLGGETMSKISDEEYLKAYCYDNPWQPIKNKLLTEKYGQYNER